MQVSHEGHGGTDPLLHKVDPISFDMAERSTELSCSRSHEVSRALWEAAAAPVDSDTSLAELCRQVAFRFQPFVVRLPSNVIFSHECHRLRKSALKRPKAS